VGPRRPADRRGEPHGDFDRNPRADADPCAHANPSTHAHARPATIPLDGTTASGDIDVANSAAQITGTLPGVPNFAGELVVVGGNAYLRAPGQATFSTEAASSLPLNPADSSSGLLPEFQTILTTIDDKSLSPKLVGIESRPGGPCYHIQVQATPDVVGTGLGLTGQGVGYAIVDLWIYQSSFLIEHMELHTSDPVRARPRSAWS